MEDIDPPREQAGAADLIIRALDAYGFEWDGPVIYQSRNLARHREAIRRLVTEGHAYRCGCTRRDLAAAPMGALGTIYPGTCRTGYGGGSYAIRVRTSEQPIRFVDLLQGPRTQRLEAESGDFVIQRRDRLIAYHLAVVVDDFEQDVTHIVRGVDLLDSTPRHIHLQRLLGFSTPEYAHIPVAIDAKGQKLSKQSGATAIPIDKPGATLVAAFRALGLNPPAALSAAAPAHIWDWAVHHWSIDILAGQRQLPGAAGREII